MIEGCFRFRTDSWLLCCTIGLLLFGPQSFAQEEPAVEPFRAVTRPVAPFAMQDAEGTWSGISIDLWKLIASELGRDSEIYAAEDLDAMLADAESGTADAAVGAITVTAAREERLDFSHPFYTTGLGIAVRPEGSLLVGLIKAMVSWEFLTAISSLLFVLFSAGAALWFFEHRKNAAQFGGSRTAGLGNGLWWAAVTMTTVGYGDKAPVTLGGRVVAMVWMYASVIIISFFTAGIATSLTVGSLRSGLSGPEDLAGATVGVVRGSTGETFAERVRAKMQRYDDVVPALEALAAGELDAVVYDRPMLAFHATEIDADGINLLPGTFDRQDYAIALPNGSDLREDINHRLLEIIKTPAWESTIERYLGRGN